MNHPRATWCIGADLGGTWLRVLARRDGARRAHTRPAPTREDLPGVLERLWRGWGVDPDDAALVVASRGVWTAGERHEQERRLAATAARVRVIPDVEAAHRGALGDRPGVLLIGGTGSIALARAAGGRWARAGGLGPLLGDEGSAFWLGREWLRADGGAARFALVRRLLRAPDPVAAIAALAPLVLRRARAGAAPARAIVLRAQEALAALVAAPARQLHLRAPVSVSWSGGLLDDERFRGGVWRAVRRHGLRIDVTEPRESAVAAAVRLAASMAELPAPRRPSASPPVRAVDESALARGVSPADVAPRNRRAAPAVGARLAQRRMPGGRSSRIKTRRARI